MKTLIATIAIVTMIGLIAIACDPSPTTPPTAPTRSTPVLQPTPVQPAPAGQSPRRDRAWRVRRTARPGDRNLL